MTISGFYPAIGGTEIQALRLATQLIKKDVEVRVITGRWSHNLPKRDIIGIVPVFRNSTLWDSFIRYKYIRAIKYQAYQISLAWYLFRHREFYNIIHAHQAFLSAFISVIMAKLLRKKILIKIGCGGKLSDLIMMKNNVISPFGRLMWKSIRKCDHIIALNNEIKKELLSDGFLPQQIICIPNGVDTTQFPQKKNYTIINKLEIVSIGRLDPQKGFDILIKSIKFIEPKHFRCTILGQGKELMALQRLSYELQLDDFIEMRGEVQNVVPYLHQADIFVLASRAEGLSNALLEAMSCALPCIATNIGGNEDLLSPNKMVHINRGEFFIGDNGILVSPNDPEGIALAIQFLQKNESERVRLGSNARNWIIQYCSLSSITEKYIHLYNKMVNNS